MTYNPLLSSSSSQPQIVNQLNSVIQNFNNEQTTKSFSGTNGKPMIVQGRIRASRYGQLYYDSTGVARILIGQSPDDGRMGIWVSKPGQDVITLLGG